MEWLIPALITGVVGIGTAIGNWIHGAKEASEEREQASEDLQTQIDATEEEAQKARDFQSAEAEKEREFQSTQQASQLGFAEDALEQQKDIANKNLEFMQSQFDYQKQLNQTQMEREDTAIQRQMADAKAAGLSPLSVVGGNGASSQALTSGEAPQIDPTGISAAQGQYLDIAKQYSALHLQANKQFIDNINDIYRQSAQGKVNAYTANQARKQAIHAQQQGARLAMYQMIQDSIAKGVDVANASKQLKMQKALNDAQLGVFAQQEKNLESERLYRDAERTYNEEHGFRNQDLETALVSLGEYIYDHRNEGTVAQAREKVQQVVDTASYDLGFTKESREDITRVEESKYHSGQRPTEYLVSQKNAIEIYSDLSKGNSPKDKDILKLWDSTPKLRAYFNNNFNNFKSACNSKKFIKDIIWE